MDNDGHKYKFGGPSGGWPQFGPDGKRIRDEEQEEVQDDEESR